MTNPKGTELETAAVRWLRLHGWPHARRIVKEGTRDKGDITLGDGLPLTIEAKNTRKIDLAGTMKELGVEMRNADVPWGFAIIKKKGTTDVGNYYAVLPVGVLNEILAGSLGRSLSFAPPSATNKGVSAAAGAPPRRKRLIPRSG